MQSIYSKSRCSEEISEPFCASYLKRNQLDHSGMEFVWDTALFTAGVWRRSVPHSRGEDRFMFSYSSSLLYCLTLPFRHKSQKTKLRGTIRPPLHEQGSVCCFPAWTLVPFFLPPPVNERQQHHLKHLFC